MAKDLRKILEGRNPATIQDEAYERRQDRYWAEVKAWSNKPGGKY